MVVSFEGSAHALSLLLEAGCYQDESDSNVGNG